MLRQKTKRLTFLQQHEHMADWAEIKQLKTYIDHLLAMEDLQWKQRAKWNWYHEGDRNTRYFHAWANHRRKINHIGQIRDDQGAEWLQSEEINIAFLDYFQQLFSTSSLGGIDACVGVVPHRVSAEMNSKLLCPFLSEEVDTALSQMHPTKSSGSNGFAPCFFQKHWAVVGNDVHLAMLRFMNTGFMAWFE